MRNRTKTSEDQGQAIDLTPMLDVVFIMLIFFIVTATFIKLPGVDITKVDTQTSDPYKKVGILVAVSGNNEYWIDKKRTYLSMRKESRLGDELVYIRCMHFRCVRNFVVLRGTITKLKFAELVNYAG